MPLAIRSFTGLASNASAVVLLAALAQSAVFTVTNTNDAGAGSLRQAILDSNALPGADTVEFDASFFATPKVINLLTGELAITDHLTINGPTAPLTISGALSSRIFHVNGSGTINVTINRVKLAGGDAGFAVGGALLIQDESVTLNDCFVDGNRAYDGGGVRLMAAGAALTANRCSFRWNYATRDGGAISAEGSATITLVDSTISGNAASRHGGGVDMATGGALSVRLCTMASNQAQRGGAICVDYPLTPGLLQNSTFSGNSATVHGGALEMTSVFPSAFNVQNCTFTANTTNGSGGAILSSGVATTMVLASSIVFGNTSGSGSPAIFTTGVVNASTSLVSSTSGIATWNGDAYSNSHIGVDPVLGPLANNGGPTQTHAIALGSPAIDTGSNPAGLTTDQRGAGYARRSNPTCQSDAIVDIGSFEAQCPCGTLPVAYCTAGTTSSGCVPSISSTGAPSATASSGCTVSVLNVEGQKQGIVFYGVTGRNASVWAPGSSSYLCVKTPTQRTLAQNSGGTSSACNGIFSLKLNDYWSTHPTALGQPLAAGQLVNVQAWFRDPAAPGTTNLSNALELVLCP